MIFSEPLFILFLAISVILIGGIIWASKGSSERFGQIGGGLAGIILVLGAIGGAMLYHLEGRNRPKQSLAAQATAVPLAPLEGQGPRALIQFIGSVTNQGMFHQEYDCVALDARGFRHDVPMERGEAFRYDLQPEPLLTGTRGGAQWDRCMEVESARWRWNEQRRLRRSDLSDGAERPFSAPDSGYRYDPFPLAPGETRTRHFELEVSCARYAAVRFIFVVPTPGTQNVHEAKAIVPLNEVCAASRRMNGDGSEAPTRLEPATTVDFAT